MYLHQDKENNWCFIEDLEEELGVKMTDEAKSNFSYCLYELAVEVEIDLETGNWKILGIKED